MVTEDGIEACLVVGGKKLICSQVASLCSESDRFELSLLLY